MATSQGTRLFQMFLLSVGLMMFAFGVYATGPRLVEWAILYVKSSPGMLAAESVALLHRLRIGMIVGGLAIAASSVALGYLEPFFIRLNESLLRRVDPAVLAAGAVSFLGRWLSRGFAIVMQERVLWSVLLIILFTIPVAGFFLSPAGGFHVEGLDLQPAKNLARHGIYATLTTRGFDELTHRSSAGPAIILPSAFAFWLFGVNVDYSRAIALVFVIATPFVFYRVARIVYGREVAMLSVFLFAPKVMPFLGGDAGTGSDGYIPGLFYFLVGTLFWFKSVEEKRTSLLVLTGIFWALSFQSKWLFLFAVIASIATFVLLRLAGRQIGHRNYLFPMLLVALVTLGWTAFRAYDLGLRQEFAHLTEFWGEHGHRAFQIGDMLPQLAMLADVGRWGETELVLILVSLTYWAIRVFRGRMADYRDLFLGVFVLTWSAWWLLFNFDLPDLHMKIPILIAHLFIAKLLYDFWNAASAQKETFLRVVQPGGSLGSAAAFLFRVAMAIIILQNVFIPLSARAQTIYHRYYTLTKPEQEMTAYIRANLEKNAVLSGWSWSLPFYIDLDPAGDHITKDRSTYPLEQREKVPEYFIVSPEFPLVKTTDEWPSVTADSEWTRKQNETRKKFIAEDCELIKTFGGPVHQWIVYKVKNDKLDSPSPIVPSGA